MKPEKRVQVYLKSSSPEVFGRSGYIFLANIGKSIQAYTRLATL